MKTSRRNVLKGIAAVGTALGLPMSSKAALTPIDTSLPVGTTILFQGDSITDAGRSEGHYYANQAAGMGRGYVRHIVTELMGEHPEKKFRFYNRGVSGHKVYQLRDRWNDDCLMLEPDVVSIMIGVNDFWHTIDFNYDADEHVYEKDLDALLAWTKKELPNVKLIIGEPFVCMEGTAIKKDKWEGEFVKYQQACRRMSDKHGAIFVPYQQVFDEALKKAPTSYWCPDGVHPSMAGTALMADAWLKAFEKLG